DTLGDIGTLGIDRGDDPAGVAIEAGRSTVESDAVDRFADDLGKFDVRVGGDLTGDDDEAGGDERFAGHAGMRILPEDRVEDGIGDLISHLVGMTFGHRFRGEGPAGHIRSLVTTAPIPGSQHDSWGQVDVTRCARIASNTASATPALVVNGTSTRCSRP